MIRPHQEYVDFIVESESKTLGSLRIEFCNKAENRKPYHELKVLYGIEDLKMRRNFSLLNQMHYQSKDEINIMLERCERMLRSNNKVKMKYAFSSLTKLHNSPYSRGVKL